MGDVARYVFRIGKDGLGYYFDLGPFALGDADGYADASMLRSTDRAPGGADPCRPQSAPPFRSRYPEGSAHLPPSAPIGPGAADVVIQLVSATGRFRSAAVIVPQRSGDRFRRHGDACLPSYAQGRRYARE